MKITIKCICILLFCVISSNSYAARKKYFFKEYHSEISVVTNNNGDTLKLSTHTNVFETDSIRMEFITRPTFIEFTLTNKTKHAITINWDKIVYIDENNKSNQIIHAGIRYIDRNNPQVQITIAPLSKIEDILQPVKNVYYASGEFGGWRVANLFPYYTKDIEIRNSWRDKYIGCTYSIFFPITFVDALVSYKFDFRIDKITVEQHNPDKFIYLTMENHKFSDEL